MSVDKVNDFVLVHVLDCRLFYRTSGSVTTTTIVNNSVLKYFVITIYEVDIEQRCYYMDNVL